MPTAKLPTSELFEEASADVSRAFAQGYTEELHPIRDEVLQYHGAGDPGTYEKLLSDDQVYATFEQLRTAVVARETVVEAGGPSALDKAAADHLRAQLLRVSWDRTCKRMLTALMYGYGVAETLYDLDAQGLVVMRAIKVRRPARFRFGVDGSVWQIAPQRVRMPERKMWTFTCGADSDDDPHGRGLGHTLYWLVWFKRNAIKFWAQFLERFSAPIPSAKVPPGTTKEQRDSLLGDLEAFIAGGKIVVPKSVELEIIQAMKDSGGDYDRFCIRLDGAIAKVVRLQTMTTDNGSSLSQAEVHLDVATMADKMHSDLVTESFTAGPATWLTTWNFPGAATPVIYRDFRKSEDTKALAETDVQLKTVGWVPTAARIAEVYGDGYERDTSAAQGQQQPAAFAEGELPQSFGDSAQELGANNRWREVIGPEVSSIDAIFAQCKTLDEARDRLGDAFLRDPASLTESLARVLFSANVAGQVGAEEALPKKATE